MKPEDQKMILADVLKAAQSGDTAQVSELITKLSEDYGAVNADLVLNTGRVHELTGKVTALQEQNLKLFLKMGDTPIPEQVQDEDKKLKFEDLFDPKTKKLKEV
jgi:hypothetical protein